MIKKFGTKFLSSITFIALTLLSATSYAEIKIKDNVTPFISNYQHLTHKTPVNNKRFILDYEKAFQTSLSQIFYEGHRSTDDPEARQELNHYAAHLPELVAKYQQKIPEITEVIHEVDKKYQQLFDVKLKTKVYFYTTISQSDAVTTGGPNMGPIIALNLKTVADYSRDDLKILLAHEFFHVLQHQVKLNIPDSEKINENMFVEGWATYASSLVYPGLPDWKYISFFEKNNKQYLKFEADRPLIIKSILRDWNKSGHRSIQKYFMADIDASKPFEPRSGYYLGYVAAKRIASEQSPKAAALLTYDEYKRIIKPVLKKMMVA